MVRILLSVVCLFCTHVHAAETNSPAAESEPESPQTRKIIAERIVTIDGQPTVLQVEIEAPSIDQDRNYSDAELMELLKRYSGRWFGTTRISLIDGRTVAEMDTELTYRMENRPNGTPVLRGTGIYVNGSRISYAYSESWIEDNTLFSRIEEQEEKRTYVGRVQNSGNTITWLPVVAEGEPHTEQITEYLIEHEGRPGLVSLGLRQHIRPEYETLLIIRSELLLENGNQEQGNNTGTGDTSVGQIRGLIPRNQEPANEPSEN